MKGIPRLPNTVDIEINGVCNLACAWCWGPVHSPTIETVSNDEWISIIPKLYEHGTRSIIITGGEPLLRTDLISVIRAIKKYDMRVTLSTNGTLLPPLLPILPFIDDIGLPIDGSDHGSNAKMRISENKNLRHLESVLKTIQYVHTNHPQIRLTIRTVVSNKNYENVSAIGKTIIKSGIDPKGIRWKLYQISPEGPRHDTTVGDGWLIEDSLFRQVAQTVLEENPDFSNITFMAIEKSIKRYLLLDPSGNSFVLGPDESGHPTQIPVGNIITGFNDFMHTLDRNQYFPSDATHGV